MGGPPLPPPSHHSREIFVQPLFLLSLLLHFGASAKKEIDSLGPCIFLYFVSFFSLVNIKLPVGPYWSPTGLWSVGLALILLIDRQ